MNTPTPQQRAVIQHALVHPVTVVSAGAGSGKTFTIVETVLQLIEARGASIDAFALITFTNKAADELRGRLESAFRQKYTAATGDDRRLWRGQLERLNAAFTGTIHGFCNLILKEYGYQHDLPHDTDITFSATLQAEAAQDALEVELTRPDTPLLHEATLLPPFRIQRLAMSILDQLRNRGLSTTDLVQWTAAQTTDPADQGHQYRAAVASLVHALNDRYRHLKRERHALDSGDLLELTLALLEGEGGSEITAQLARRIQYLFVDEFQDTDELQKRLLDRLVPHLQRVLVVGDRKQSIYGFRGAQVSLLGTMAQQYCHADPLPLSLSRRPSRTLLTAQNTLFRSVARSPAGDFSEFQDTLDALPDHPDPDDDLTDHPLTLVNAGRRTDRTERIRATAQVLAHLLRDLDILRESPTPATLTPLRPADMAILVRSNADLEAYEQGLCAHGLPVKRDTGTRFFGQPEIIATAQFLDLLLHYPDDALLALNLSGPYLPTITLHADEAAQLQNPAPGPALCAAFARQHPERNEHLRRFGQHLKTDTVPQFLARMYQETGILDRYRSAGQDRAAFHLEHLREVARRLAATEQSLTPAGFLGWLQAMILTDQDLDIPDVQNTEEQRQFIPILTVHRAKGLEYPVVIIPEVQKDLKQDFRLPEFLIEPGWGLDLHLPDLDRNPASARYAEVTDRFKQLQVEEEMRVFYVAVTRAQRAVYLIGSGDPGTANLPTTPISWQKELYRARISVESPPRVKLPFADGRATD
ncbi:UvrD-helicase domain-containing protein [Deinococcus knuensis]|uniref:DNA 3'-5' helicase n=1 Tax=Deinococcus knuensis TaxID=1837380 RepID=A0ABQ2STP8_9DEIO|nr:UvrD-helicase domain-containing protein [Deinococcus knuensis]GGS37514.1 hypothetical protein GCM10008961_31350 [Deinococcus knuensis]